MAATARSTLAPLLATLALTSLAGCPGPAEDGDPAATVPFPAKSGIKQDLSLASLTSGGWTVCEPVTSLYYGSDTDFTVAGFDATVAGSCGGNFMMLACGQEGSDTLALAAADDRFVVLLPDAVAPTVPHAANGVSWYYDDSLSIGFAPSSAPVDRATWTCDYAAGETSPELRLCWEADAGDFVAGFRCGAAGTPDAPMSTAWKRYVLVHD